MAGIVQRHRAGPPKLPRMAEPAPFVAHCLELLAALGPARARRMFGGHGLYVSELFVALVANERLYLKADATSREAFERAGCEPFAYSARDRKAVTLGYWSAPYSALDSPQAMLPWARLALAAALRAQARPRAPAATAKPATPPRARVARSRARRPG
jgi:DNA transformation protein and related proteins